MTYLKDKSCEVCKGKLNNRSWFRVKGAYFCCEDHMDKWMKKNG